METVESLPPSTPLTVQPTDVPPPATPLENYTNSLPETLKAILRTRDTLQEVVANSEGLYYGPDSVATDRIKYAQSYGQVKEHARQGISALAEQLHAVAENLEKCLSIQEGMVDKLKHETVNVTERMSFAFENLGKKCLGEPREKIVQRTKKIVKLEGPFRKLPKRPMLKLDLNAYDNIGVIPDSDSTGGRAPHHSVTMVYSPSKMSLGQVASLSRADSVAGPHRTLLSPIFKYTAGSDEIQRTSSLSKASISSANSSLSRGASEQSSRLSLRTIPLTEPSTTELPVGGVKAPSDPAINALMGLRAAAGATPAKNAPPAPEPTAAAPAQPVVAAIPPPPPPVTAATSIPVERASIPPPPPIITHQGPPPPPPPAIMVPPPVAAPPPPPPLSISTTIPPIPPIFKSPPPPMAPPTATGAAPPPPMPLSTAVPPPPPAMKLGGPPPPPPPMISSGGPPPPPQMMHSGGPPPPPPPMMSSGGPPPPPPPMISSGGPPPPPPMMSFGMGGAPPPPPMAGGPPPPPPPSASSGGEVDLQAALQNALKNRNLKPAAPPADPATPTTPTTPSGGGLSLQEQLAMAVKNRGNLQKKPPAAPETAAPKSEPAPEPAASGAPISMQDQLKLTLQKRAQRATQSDAPQNDQAESAAKADSPKPKAEPAMDFQSQLRSALKTRSTPSNTATSALESLQKKADSDSPAQQVSTGSIRDRWKNMEKAAAPGPTITLRKTSSTRTASEVEVTVPKTESSAAKSEPAAAIPAAPILPPAPGIPPGTIVKALADYTSAGEGQVSMTAGETFKIVKWDYGNGWAMGESVEGGKSGIFPQTYVQRVM